MTVRHLHHFALQVPDLELGRRFWEDFGLDAYPSDDRVTMKCAGRDQEQVVLVEGPKRKLAYVCFGTDQAGLEEIERRVRGRNDVQVVDPPEHCAGPGLWLRDWENHLTNVRVAEPAPSLGGPNGNGAQPEWRINQPGHYVRMGVRGAPDRDMPVKPRRLGHVLHFTTDFERRFDFYQNVLGLRLSDRSGDLVAFLHCAGGSDHHVLGLIKDEHTGFHHASFEVGNVDEVGIGGSRMLAKGYRDGWGFGRHVIGSNFFHYIRDPWDGMAEYFCDIDYIPGDMEWEARDWPAEDSLYLWGPNVPEEFGRNFEPQD